MSSVIRDEVEAAVGAVANDHGHVALKSPRQLHALLADLVSQPSRDHRAEIRAIVAAADELRLLDTPVDDDAIRRLAGQIAAATSVVAGDARWAVRVVAEARALYTSGQHTLPTVGIAAGVVATLLAVAGIWTLFDDNTPTRADPLPSVAVSATTPAAAPTPAASAQAEQQATAQATTTPGAELPLTTVELDTWEVARTWRLDPDAFHGQVAIEGLVDAAPGVGDVHSEPVPLAVLERAGGDVALDDFTFADEAATSYANGVLGYPVSPAPGEQVTLDYQIDFDEPVEPSVELLRGWWEAWSEGAAELLGEVPQPVA